MKFNLLILNIIVILGLSGCASKSISPDKLNSISKIGVLSLNGSKMEAIERGITIFGNEDNMNDISNWNIDSFIQKVMADNLSNRNFAVLQLPLSLQEIDTFNSTKGANYDTFFKQHMIENNVDTLLVLIRGNYVPEIHDITSGIAVIKAKALGMENTALKLNFYLRGYQLTNGEIKLLHHNHISGISNIDNSLWKNTKKPITEKNLITIQKPAQDLLTKSINQTMKSIGY